MVRRRQDWQKQKVRYSLLVFPGTEEIQLTFHVHREQAEDKKAAAAAAKAARDAQLAAEEETARTSNVPKTPKSGKNSTPKKTEPSRGLDLSQLDTETPPADKKVLALNATGIDNAIDALSLTTTSASADQVDKHPERRRKAAYAAFEARRLKEIEEENPGLRRQQRIELCRKEFEKSPENPFNQSNARYDASKEELREIKEKERDRKEGLLVEK